MRSPARAAKFFNLTRAYSLVSLAGVIVVALVLSIYNRELITEALIEVQNESNSDLTRAFADVIWGKHADFFLRARAIPRDQLARQPELDAIRAELKRRTRGMRVVKIKLYDKNGLTLFSTDPVQIGEEKADNPGVRAALSGATVSHLTFRDRIDTFDNMLVNRDLLSSYVPVHQHGSIVGAFELYTDVTTLLGQTRRTQYVITASVTALMLILYLFLLGYVRRADAAIREHEAKQAEAQQEHIRYLSRTDQLTGLPNRSQLIQLLEQALAYAGNGNPPVAVFYLDIDNFKLINDSLGQENGDRVILELAGRIGGHTELDAVARTGPDEAALIKSYCTADVAARVAKQLVRLLSAPMQVADTEVSITVSIGIALSVDPDMDPEDLVRRAELAMRLAKQQGRNRYAYYSEGLEAHAMQRFELESGLRKALAQNQFELYYQPRVDANSRHLLGAEALLRWRTDDGQLISPDTFIGALEEMDLIAQVGAWTLEQACRQCRGWHRKGHTRLRVSVNLSVNQLNSNRLLTDVRAALESADLDADFLELELTESMLAGNGADTTRKLQALKAIGVHLSIDDFGTGYSSLSYLARFPIDALKIDRTFVHDASQNPDHATLTRTIVAMAQSLRLRTVAEGVETEAHRDFLVGLGCDELQGYLLSAPLSAGEFRRYMKNYEPPTDRLRA